MEDADETGPEKQWEVTIVSITETDLEMSVKEGNAVCKHHMEKLTIVKIRKNVLSYRHKPACSSFHDPKARGRSQAKAWAAIEPLRTRPTR